MGTVQQGGSGEQPASPDDRLAAATVDCALVPLFRGRFCDVLLPDRAAVLFDEDDVIYELGDDDRVLFFIRDGLVKTGTITSQGREIIYDIRKSGDVVGELCALESVRRDRAVALARTEAVAVRFDEVVDVLAGRPALLREFTQVLCNALSEAYAQVNSLADDDVMQRLVNVLLNLAGKFGRPLGECVEIGTYLTQEELSQMVVARRERVSTALNSLRRRGIVHYSPRGHLRVDVARLRDGA
ncbi:MAG TPA: Crp/Fnr family transcriptional regulator [Woeseiaceae bacterium]|nr:Crp/Fnr family transcriptional regulator [Woeseiaceae bacterium]